MKIEFVKVFADKTWDTEIIDVPESATTWGCNCDNGKMGEPIPWDNPHWDAAVIAWVQGEDGPGEKDENATVVFWGIYNSGPDLMEKEG